MFFPGPLRSKRCSRCDFRIACEWIFRASILLALIVGMQTTTSLADDSWETQDDANAPLQIDVLHDDEVWLPSQTLIREAGSEFALDVRILARPADQASVGNLYANAAVSVKAALVRLPDEQIVFDSSVDVNLDHASSCPATKIAVPPVSSPGFYVWRIQLCERDASVWSRFSKPEVIANQHWPMVVRASIAGGGTAASLSSESAAVTTWKTIDGVQASGHALARSVRDPDGNVFRWGATIPTDSIGRWVGKSHLPAIPGISVPDLFRLPMDNVDGKDVATLNTNTSVKVRFESAALRASKFGPITSEQSVHRIRVRYRADDAPVFSLSSGSNSHDTSGHRKTIVLDTRSRMSASSSPTGATFHDACFLVQPRDGSVEAVLGNQGKQSVAIESLWLERLDVPLSDRPSRTSPMQRSAWLRLDPEAWASELSTRTGQANRSSWGQGVEEGFQLYSAAFRLRALLTANHMSGVLLPMKAEPAVTADQPFPLTLANALALASVDVATESEIVGSRSLVAAGLHPVLSVRRSNAAPEDSKSLSPVVILRPNRIDSGDRNGKQQHLAGLHASLVNEMATSIGRDEPAVLIVDVPAGAFPLSDRFSGLMNQFRTLPKGRSILLETSNDGPVIVRSYQDQADVNNSGGRVQTISVCNTAPWPSALTLTCDRPVHWAADDRDLNRKPPEQTLNTNLAPGEWRVIHALSIGNEPSRVVAAKTTLAGGSDALRNIQWSVTKVVERIGLLDRFSHALYQMHQLPNFEPPMLSNGGFEHQGEIGLSGWVHSQFPKDAVSVDTVEASEGTRSVRMANAEGEANPAWLVSETIPAPSTSRLAITASLRGELNAPLNLRVTLEGKSEQQPIRRSVTFTAVAHGKWLDDQILLETVDLPTGIESYRVVIESRNAGVTHIDNIQVHTWFPLQKERKQIQTQAYLAVDGLRNGDLVAASALLQNRWAFQLMEWHDSQQTALDVVGLRSAVTESSEGTSASGSTEPMTPASDAEPTAENGENTRSTITDRSVPSKTVKPTGIADRFRNLIPRPLRF